MIFSEEMVLERIAKVFLEASYDSLSTVEALEQLRTEIKQQRADRNRESFERAMSAPYRVQRIAQGRTYNQMSDTYTPTNFTAEIVQLTRRDFPEFAKEKGLDLTELMAVVESRQKQVVGKGGAVWRHYPDMFVDHTPREEDLAEMRADMLEEERIKGRNERSNQAREASAKGEPELTFFHVTGVSK